MDGEEQVSAGSGEAGSWVGVARNLRPVSLRPLLGVQTARLAMSYLASVYPASLSLGLSCYKIDDTGLGPCPYNLS